MDRMRVAFVVLRVYDDKTPTSDLERRILLKASEVFASEDFGIERIVIGDLL